MSKQKINHNHFPYQVINEEVYDLVRPLHRLKPEHFLIKKPLVPLLLYLTSEGANIEDSTEWCESAAKIGDLEALQWLRDAGAPWDEDTCIAAAWHGHLEVLRWARVAGAPWDHWVCSYAAMSGHIDIFRWARAAGAPWDEWVCAYAAGSGHIEILQWARAAGAPWDETTCSCASRYDRFSVLKWAYVNGCPCYGGDETQAQILLLTDKDINWSLQCKEKWSNYNRKSFLSMIDQVVNKYNKVTYSILPDCLSNLVITYL